jgi:uncharacterized protein
MNSVKSKLISPKKRLILPDKGVYTRIGCSKIHGVGVFAIRKIKKGANIFWGDDSEINWIDKKLINKKPRAIKKLYEDFCIVQYGRYGCPRNFNLLTVAWYMNHSEKPNVIADKHYRFWAKKDIKKGEELTVNYFSFSEY